MEEAPEEEDAPEEQESHVDEEAPMEEDAPEEAIPDYPFRQEAPFYAMVEVFEEDPNYLLKLLTLCPPQPYVPTFLRGIEEPFPEELHVSSEEQDEPAELHSTSEELQVDDIMPLEEVAEVSFVADELPEEELAEEEEEPRDLSVHEDLFQVPPSSPFCFEDAICFVDEQQEIRCDEEPEAAEDVAEVMEEDVPEDSLDEMRLYEDNVVLSNDGDDHIEEVFFEHPFQVPTVEPKKPCVPDTPIVSMYRQKL